MDTTIVSGAKPKKAISLVVAALIVVFFTLLCALSGYVIGYKFFWPKLVSIGTSNDDLALYIARVKQSPKDLASLNKLAWLAYQEKQYALCIDTSNKILRISPKDPNAHYIAGLSYYDQKKFQQAEQDFSFLFQNYPNNTLALLGLSKVYLGENKPDKAVPLLQSLIYLDQGEADGYLYLGIAYGQEGQKTKALQQLQLCLRLSPENQLAKEWINKLGGETPSKK